MKNALYRNISVEVLAEYHVGIETFAAIRAIEDKPFHRKDEWLTKTEYATVKVDELTDIKYESENESDEPNILERTLSFSDKKQWSSGEGVWLWRKGNKGVFLKEQDGFVALNITGYREYLNVFWLNPKTWSWEVSRNLGSNYYQWIDQYKGDMR